jgi:hypothetical protein
VIGCHRFSDGLLEVVRFELSRTLLTSFHNLILYT